MSNPVTAYETFSGYFYESLISWRNQPFKENGKPAESAIFETGELSTLRKIGAEIAFIPLVFLGLIEGVIREALCIVSLPLALLLGSADLANPNVFNKFARITLVGGTNSLAAAIGSTIGLVQNFREEELRPNINNITKEYVVCCCME